MTLLPTGKLPADLLRQLLHSYVAAGDRVVVGPAVGQDVAISDFGDRYLVAKTDPITYATDQIGRYAVHINANDVACSGAVPRWYLATVLLPAGRADGDMAIRWSSSCTAAPKASEEMAETIFDQTARACRQLGVAWCGGHTEVVHDLPRPIVVGQMLGEVAPDECLTTAGARVGDSLILTKGIAIEGTAIIAREKPDRLREVFSDADLRRCANLLDEPGISVVKDAQVAIRAGGVHALHDPTEGGVATGLWELAEAAHVGIVVDQKRLPLLPECETLCRHFGLDPLGLIASGSLLIAADKSRSAVIVEALAAEGIPAAVIGETVPPEHGCRLQMPDGSFRPLPSFPSDEITRLFAD